MISRDLQTLKQWVYDNLCKGRKMKCHGDSATDVVMREPKCFLMRLPSIQNNGLLLPDEAAMQAADAMNIAAPFVVIVMRKAGVRNRDPRMSEERQDGKRGYMEVQFLFATYDPGHRTRESQEAGGIQTAIKNIRPNDDEAIGVVLDWAEEAMSKLLEAGGVPGTGWVIEKDDWEYGPLADDNGFLADRWPYIYAVVSGTFTMPSTGVTAAGYAAGVNDGTRPIYLE